MTSYQNNIFAGMCSFLEVIGDEIHESSLQRDRGASDLKNCCRNENFSKFAIGAVYRVSLRDALSEKLWLVKVRKADG